MTIASVLSEAGVELVAGAALPLTLAARSGGDADGASFKRREARAAARSAGFQGAMFPWQSGSDGQEETQELNLNHRSQRWVPDNSYLQRHVGSAIAYNVWQYFQVTHDVEFLQFRGAELILDIARFWSSIASFDEERERYEIRGVMGPDEFHEGYPGLPTPGLNNNAYTNIMAVWVLCRALEVLDLLPEIRRTELMTRLGLSADEMARWGDISRRMYLPFHGDGIISQFEGYEQLAELDWEDSAPGTAISSASISSSRRRTTARTAISCRSRLTC